MTTLAKDFQAESLSYSHQRRQHSSQMKTSLLEMLRFMVRQAERHLSKVWQVSVSAVRNSGAIAVVEGVGDHGCEYMTGGQRCHPWTDGKELCSWYERRYCLCA